MRAGPASCIGVDLSEKVSSSSVSVGGRESFVQDRSGKQRLTL